MNYNEKNVNDLGVKVITATLLEQAKIWCFESSIAGSSKDKQSIYD